MKKLVVLFVVLWMLFGICEVSAVDVYVGSTQNADEYSLENDNYPNAYWEFDSREDWYSSKGWHKYTGVLWYDSENHAVELGDISVNEIQELYNKGYTFHVLYSWISDGRLFGCNSEQSVSVGHWILSPKQAKEYHQTYVVPELRNIKNSPDEIRYVTQWYYDGVASSDPTGEESQEDLNKFLMVRHCYNFYDFGYGQKLYLKNGKMEQYTFEQAIEISQTVGFQNEMQIWN